MLTISALIPALISDSPPQIFAGTVFGAIRSSLTGAMLAW